MTTPESGAVLPQPVASVRGPVPRKLRSIALAAQPCWPSV